MRAALAPAVTQAASRMGAIGVTGFAAARTFRRMAGLVPCGWIKREAWDQLNYGTKVNKRFCIFFSALMLNN
jgi:hypothetical protein